MLPSPGGPVCDASAVAAGLVYLLKYTRNISILQ
jgi:hypothetical protein